MALNSKLEAKLSKRFETKARVDDTFSGKDITFITNENGDPITLFIGNRRADGAIQGERYVRHIQYAEDGTTVKSSHWDAKGKVTRA